MADLLSDFLDRPDAASYLALRDAILEDPGFDLFADGLGQMDERLAAEEYDQALDMVPALMPNWLLSPHMHWNIAAAAQARGDTTRVSQEVAFAQACLVGLSSSGDGSYLSPYCPIHIQDETDLLVHLKCDRAAQRQEIVDERIFDVLTDTNGTDHWFDVTAPVLRMSQALEAE